MTLSPKNVKLHFCSLKGPVRWAPQMGVFLAISGGVDDAGFDCNKASKRNILRKSLQNS